jgi:hypothetical protein
MTSLCSMCQLHAFERTVYLQKLKVKGKSLLSDNQKCRIDCQLLWKKKLPNKPILQKLASSMMHFLSSLIVIPYFLYAWEFTKIWSNITPMAVRFELNVVLHLQNPTCKLRFPQVHSLTNFFTAHRTFRYSYEPLLPLQICQLSIAPD